MALNVQLDQQKKKNISETPVAQGNKTVSPTTASTNQH